jgi:dihydroflavonol-4-reductase
MQNKSTKKNCLVTGATGFLGSNLVHELVKQGWDVRASGMHGSETKYINDLPIEIVFADITIAEEVDAIVESCDYVFHVAADTSFWKRNFTRQKTINVDGTINVADACIKHSVKRLIHTSTLDVLGYNPTGGTYDEMSGHYNFNNMGYNYGDTKLEAEIQLRGYYNANKLDLVVIYPGFMIGPFDYTLQLGRVFFDLAERKLPACPPGGSSFCHVREVARAQIKAAERGRSGEGYLCAGIPSTNISYADMFGRMALSIGAKPPRLTTPKSVFVAYAQVCEWLAELTNKAPDINPGQARYMSCPQYAVSYKAQHELDYQVPSVEECIEDALAWYRANGFHV